MRVSTLCIIMPGIVMFSAEWIVIYKKCLYNFHQQFLNVGLGQRILPILWKSITYSFRKIVVLHKSLHFVIFTIESGGGGGSGYQLSEHNNTFGTLGVWVGPSSAFHLVLGY